MPSKKGRLKPARPPATRNVAAGRTRVAASPPAPVSPRWLVSAVLITLAIAAFCAWGTLCLLFWQGSWQLLYHPASKINRTPANVGLAFDVIGFATNPAGEPQLQGWWIPGGPSARYTALYLHGADGNLGETVDALARLHSAGMNVLAFDYRGYGESRFQHPSEKHWREDADSAIDYLTGTRHVPAGSIVLVGKDLGANLALETAAAHPELAGVVLEQPSENPVSPIFRDARAHLVPSHLLVRDRYDATTAAANLLVPSLWIYWSVAPNPKEQPPSYRAVPARKTLVWLSGSAAAARDYSDALTRWLDDLPKSTAGR